MSQLSFAAHCPLTAVLALRPAHSRRLQRFDGSKWEGLGKRGFAPITYPDARLAVDRKSGTPYVGFHTNINDCAIKKGCSKGYVSVQAGVRWAGPSNQPSDHTGCERAAPAGQGRAVQGRGRGRVQFCRMAAAC